MLKIYFDINVYSKIELEEYSFLKEQICEMINKEILVFYSKAHINDFGQDKTDLKLRNLERMSIICNDNYVFYDALDSKIRLELIDPLDAYDKYPPDASIEELFSEIVESISNNGDDDKLLSPMKDLVEYFMSIPIYSDIDQTPPDQDPMNLVERMGLKEKPKDIKGYISMYGKMLETLKNDKKILKDLRTTSRQIYENEKNKLNIDDPNFELNMLESSIGMSFSNFLSAVVGDIARTQGSSYEYMYLTNAYTMINFLAFDNESNRNIKYTNVINDSNHFFYGSVADLVVSDDKGFVNKSNFLYKYFKIDSEAITTDEFVKRIKSIKNAQSNNGRNLIEKIIDSISSGEVLTSKYSDELKQNCVTIKLKSRIMSAFNRCSFIEHSINSTHNVIVLYNDRSSVYHVTWIKDFKSVVDFMINFFGFDFNGNGFFSLNEYDSILVGKWGGRYWSLDKMSISITQNVISKRLNLTIDIEK